MRLKGQSLLESVLALAVIAIVLSGIAVVSTSSLSNAGHGKNQTIATQYAQEGVEVLRMIRSLNYASFRNYSGTYCLAKGASSLPILPNCPSPLTPNVDSFIRTVTVEQSPGSRCAVDVAKVTVKVSWTDGKCKNTPYCHTSNIITCFSTINPIQAP